MHKKRPSATSLLTLFGTFVLMSSVVVTALLGSMTAEYIFLPVFR